MHYSNSLRKFSLPHPNALIPSRSAFLYFLTSTTIWLLLFSFFRHVYWRDPHSAFFDSTHVYEKDYSDRRQSSGLSFLDDLVERNQTSLFSNSTSNLSGDSDGDGDTEVPDMCIAYVTIKRDMQDRNKGRQYIDAALGTMIDGLSEEERKRVWIYLLFADTDPSVHPLWGEEWLGRVVDDYGGYEVGGERREWLEELMKQKEWQIKGVFDYVYALSRCYDTHAPYIAIMEDDIVFAHDWFQRTISGLNKIESLSQSPGDKFYNWIYLRLFYTETFQSWSEEVDFWYRHRYFLLFFAAPLCTITALIFIRSKIGEKRKTGGWLDNWTIFVIGVVVVPAFITLGFMVGKHNLPWWEFRGKDVVKMNSGGCCTQAMVFPREQVDGLRSYLTGRGSGQTDLMIEDYAENEGMERLALGKQVVQHVGVKSSRGDNQINAMSTWAFHFEEYDKVSMFGNSVYEES
ncbi:uncharacterized protein EAE98_009794 [Botrytis deweyae]|uniref:Glycosyltransferase 2-like domain-containing protein n=1 Tax=Botrytis deweyae TaxID=2478750 RepID=A0ABQ7IAM4_9HELO|nr:uncharacterized protein EAE98_009794 [Botrytis deweyae]KAF7918182.1 hypothetical protein EAE98_009794 [Botrytis deweyae]